MPVAGDPADREGMAVAEGERREARGAAATAREGARDGGVRTDSGDWLRWLGWAVAILAAIWLLMRLF